MALRGINADCVSSYCDCEMTVKVSVALIAYNHERFIDDALQSVLMQKTNFPFEIVIGEDCSTDRTREILVDYQKRYPDKIRLLLRDRNLGAAGNAIETCAATTGEYVTYLDGDDYWTSEDKLQTLADYLDGHPECSMCFHNVEKRYADGRPPEVALKTNKKFFEIKDLFWRNLIASCATMCRGEMLRSFDWAYPAHMAGDRLRYIWQAQFGPIGYIDQVMGVYRLNDGGIYGHLDRIRRQQITIDTLQFANSSLNFEHDWLIKRMLSRRYLLMAYFHLCRREVVLSGRFLLQSVRVYLGSYLPKRLVSGRP